MSLAATYEAVTIIAKAQKKLTKLIGQPVQLGIISPEIDLGQIPLPGLLKSIEDVKAIVCEEMEITLEDISSQSRKQVIVDARKLATLAIYRLIKGVSIEQIADSLGYERTNFYSNNNSAKRLLISSRYFNGHFNAIRNRVITEVKYVNY